MTPTAPPVRPFIDWPVVLDPGRWQADVALIGVSHSEPYAGDEQPNDQTRAPDAVRLQSDQYAFGGRRHFDFDIGTDLASVLPPACIDCGNATRGDSEPFDDYFARVTAYLSRLWSTGAQVLLLGGDHGVTIPAIEAMATLGQRVWILHIDAHLDWREEVGGVRRGYSSPLRWASTRGWIAGMTQIGLRGTGSARRGEVEAARAYGARLFTAAAVHEQGIEPVIAAVPDDVPLYITIDADGVDPTLMPGVMGPAPGGLFYHQVAPLIARLARRQRLVGIDVVEIAPRFDLANGLTCITAGRLLVTALAAAWGGRGSAASP